MKNSYLLLWALCFALLSSCDKKETPPTPTPPTPPKTLFELQATLNGAQQADANGPAPVTTSASGTFVGAYDSKTSDLTYTITFTGLTPTNAHIHTGAPGIAGQVTIRFLQYATSPITGIYKCSPTVADDLLNNRMYVNIHTAAYSGGEIRGDIKQK